MKHAAGLLLLLCAVLGGGDAYGLGAKALFYDEGDVTLRTQAPAKAQAKRATQKKEQRPASESYLGLSYWIDLLDHQGRYVRTTTSRVFRSGDRIKLNLRSNRNGYLYVIGLGSSGTSRLLFPDREDVANGIKAKTTYAVPFGTNLKFDDTPGEEKLLVLLSQKPIPQMRQGGERVLPVQETKELMVSAHMSGSKDLVLEEEVPESAIEPARYAVIPVAALGEKGTLALQIKLKHR
jgi:hypothetical protein